MYELVYQEEGTEHVVPLSSQECLLGRSPDCDIVVKDFGVSRHHAKVMVDGDMCRVVDLKSKNGTHVNGVLVLEAFLNEGDEISLGKFYLRFQRKLEEKVILDEEKPMLEEEAGTVIRSVGDLQKYLEAEKSEVPTSEAERISVDATPGAAADIEKTNHILRSLSELAKALITAQPDQPEDVSELVMDAVFEHIPADRGFLMLLDESGDLKPRVVKNRHGGEEGKITISKTIADRVVGDRVAILTSDAQVDPRFATGESIRFHGIRSAMCVPLWKGDQVIGIIHVDSPIQANTFTESDLDLLSALANYSAIAIEQASLNRKVRKEKVARERLEKYFSPSFVTRIMSEGEMEVQELEATVLFADIVGFTPLAERLGDPRAVAEILNEYFSRMTDVIQEYDGAVDKFIGDCIMGVFGAPYWQEDHAVRAVKVAIEMRHRLEDLNKESENAGIQMRMGLNSGVVVAGPIGSQKRKEITVLGDPVNIASRIESTVAEAGQIVVGERTWELIKDDIETKDLGTFALKGKEKSVRLYEVLSEKPTATRGT
jgi:adenylate cyclase